jgi:hypothetical protein
MLERDSISDRGRAKSRKKVSWVSVAPLERQSRCSTLPWRRVPAGNLPSMVRCALHKPWAQLPILLVVRRNTQYPRRCRLPFIPASGSAPRSCDPVTATYHGRGRESSWLILSPASASRSTSGLHSLWPTIVRAVEVDSRPRNHDGVGLGLAFSHQTVLDHIGDLWAGADAGKRACYLRSCLGRGNLLVLRRF